MGVSDLFAANAEILLDEDSGLSEAWSYTPPATEEEPDPVPTASGNWLFNEDEAGTGREVVEEGEETTEYGLLDLPVSIAIDEEGTCTRLSDNTVWRIHGVVGRDKEFQTIRVSNITVHSLRKARRRGS